MRAIDASRISSQIPARSRSRPSSTVERLVVGADPRRGVRVQRLAHHARRMAVRVCGSVERELRELAGVAGDDAGEVHHLGQPDHPAPAEQALEITGRQRTVRRLEVRRGHAGRRHEVDVERQLVADVEQPVDAVGAEDVGDLVRVGDDRRRAHRQHEPRELVHEQLRRLEVHVRVDEARDDVTARRVERLGALVLAEARDVAVADGDVHVEPLAGEDGEDVAAADDEVGGLVAARNGDTPSEIAHNPTMSSGRTGTRGSSRPVAARSADATAAVETTVGGSPTPLTPYGAVRLRFLDERLLRSAARRA